MKEVFTGRRTAAFLLTFGIGVGAAACGPAHQALPRQATDPFDITKAICGNPSPGFVPKLAFEGIYQGIRTYFLTYVDLQAGGAVQLGITDNIYPHSNYTAQQEVQGQTIVDTIKPIVEAADPTQFTTGTTRYVEGPLVNSPDNSATFSDAGVCVTANHGTGFSALQNQVVVIQP